MMIDSRVAVWNGNKLVPGPNIGNLIDEIEQSKELSGEFHPHVANRILSTILEDWNISHSWKIPSSREDNLWKIRISITKFVGGRLRKFIIF
jgi:hypothetical protein